MSRGTWDALLTGREENKGGRFQRITNMRTHANIIQLISSVVGLSVGLGIGTATVILGFAALFQ